MSNTPVRRTPDPPAAAIAQALTQGNVAGWEYIINRTHTHLGEVYTVRAVPMVAIVLSATGASHVERTQATQALYDRIDTALLTAGYTLHVLPTGERMCLRFPAAPAVAEGQGGRA